LQLGGSVDCVAFHGEVLLVVLNVDTDGSESDGRVERGVDFSGAL
jgi:hypothetical protein